jgi:hypothetical protein
MGSVFHCLLGLARVVKKILQTPCFRCDKFNLLLRVRCRWYYPRWILVEMNMCLHCCISALTAAYV